MATTGQLNRRLDRLRKGDGYFTQENFVMAGLRAKPGEHQAEAMYRLWPNKVEHPWLTEIAREREAEPENAGGIQE